MSSWRNAALGVTAKTSHSASFIVKERTSPVDLDKRPYSREKREGHSNLSRSGMSFLSSPSRFDSKNLAGPKTTSPPTRNMWNTALEATMESTKLKSYNTDFQRPMTSQSEPDKSGGRKKRSLSFQTDSKKPTARMKARKTNTINKKQKSKDVMADDLDALLAEIDGVPTPKPSPEIRRVKERASAARRVKERASAARRVKERASVARRRKVVRKKSSQETKNTKLDRTLTTDMEKLMSSIEDFGAIMAQRQENDEEEEEEEEWVAEHEQYPDEDYSEGSDNGTPVMVEDSDSDDEPPEIVMVEEEKPAAPVTPAPKTDEPVDRNLGMVSSKEDFDNSDPLGWDCNVEVGQMVIVERSDGTYKYALVSNFEDDEEGLAVVEFLVDIRNSERVIKRWDVEDRPFDVRVVQDSFLDDEAEEEEEVLNIDQLDPEDEKLVQQLFVAARSGAWREIQQFCNAEPDFSLDIRDKEGYTAVAVAAFYGHVYAVEILLENGADPNLGDSDRCTPLHCAAQEGFTETVSTLIRFKADANIAMKSSGRTPLFLASQEGYTKVVKLLLDSKANANLDNKGCTSLFIAVQESQTEITKLLLQAKADPDKPSRLGTPPLLMAVQKEDLPSIHMLLDSGANVNAATPTGITALSKAMLLEYTPIVRLLKSHGAIMDPSSGEKTLKSIAKRVSSTVASVEWNDTARAAMAHRKGVSPQVSSTVASVGSVGWSDTARTAITHRKAVSSQSAYGMLTRTK